MSSKNDAPEMLGLGLVKDTAGKTSHDLEAGPCSDCSSNVVPCSFSLVVLYTLIIQC